MIVALALTVAAPMPASAQGFFDFLFGGRPQRQYVPQQSNAYADPYGAPERPPSADPSPSTGRVVSYCVRTCDGRYFPMHRTSNANPVQLCNSFCPASKTQVYTGSAIDYAVAANGARYGDSENAFVYRKQIVAGCTCNGRDAFGLAPIDAAADPTLRPGDIVMTAEGPMSLRGNKWARTALDLKPAAISAMPLRGKTEPNDDIPND